MLSHSFKLIIALVFVLFSTSLAAEIVIKMATVAPKDSIWYENLKKVDERWKLVATLGVTFLIAYFDRLNIALAMPLIAAPSNPTSLAGISSP